VKFKALIRALGIPKPYVRGLLETMWDCAHECGNSILGSPAEVEAAAEWSGKCGKLFEALKVGRWIDEIKEGCWEIHDYWDHAPEYVKGRLRKEKERKRKKQDDATVTDHTRDNPATFTGQSGDDHGMVTQTADTPAPAPAHIEETYVSSPPNKSAGKGEASPKAVKAPPKKTGKLHTPDPLFDAVADITKSDPVTARSHVCKVASLLRSAEPPYTPEEVRKLPAVLQAQKWTVFPVPLGSVEKLIGRVRAGRVAGSETLARGPAELANETRRLREEDARRDAALRNSKPVSFLSAAMERGNE
jgi:hypothetical protein